VTETLLAADTNLKVVGRAGIGVDYVDIAAATKRGVVVMNTPHGNAVTTAEHTMAMIMALVRQISEVSQSTKAGRWEKSRFMGTQLTGKWLGLVGCGNIGSIVANQALGMKMRVLDYDPCLSAENAIRLGIEKVDLDELLGRADIITVHTPLNDSTRNIISADALNKTKKGVRIINCQRGGLVDELALAAVLVEVDGALLAGVLDEIKSLPQVVRADSLQFSAQD
jgi:D-3-phosphoglycerate dehydrogenase